MAGDGGQQPNRFLDKMGVSDEDEAPEDESSPVMDRIRAAGTAAKAAAGSGGGAGTPGPTGGPSTTTPGAPGGAGPGTGPPLKGAGGKGAGGALGKGGGLGGRAGRRLRAKSGANAPKTKTGRTAENAVAKAGGAAVSASTGLPPAVAEQATKLAMRAQLGRVREAKRAVKVIGVAVALVVAVSFFAVTGGGRNTVAQAAPNATGTSQIPPTMLALYQSAGQTSNVPWAILAGLGWVQTNDGQQAPGEPPGARADPRPASIDNPPATNDTSSTAAAAGSSVSTPALPVRLAAAVRPVAAPKPSTPATPTTTGKGTIPTTPVGGSTTSSSTTVPPAQAGTLYPELVPPITQPGYGLWLLKTPTSLADDPQNTVETINDMSGLIGRLANNGDGGMDITALETANLATDTAAQQAWAKIIDELPVAQQPGAGGDFGATVVAQAVMYISPNCGGAVPTAAASPASATNANATQVQVADQIIGIAKSLNIPAQGIVVALDTALTENGLTNSSATLGGAYGAFQQTPSAGWGSLADVTNVLIASESFFGAQPAGVTHNTGLEEIPNWQSLPIYAAAQAVQQSGAGQSSNGQANYGPNVAEAQAIAAKEANAPAIPLPVPPTHQSSPGTVPAAGGTPTGAATPAAAPQSVTIVGDSLIVGAQTQGNLQGDLTAVGVTKVDIQATVGSGLTTAGQGAGAPRNWPAQIPQLVASDHPAELVIALGTNDYSAPNYGADVSAVLASVPATQQILWILPAQAKSLMPGIAAISAQIVAATAGHPNVRTADSNTPVSANPQWVDPSGVHYTAAGYQGFAQFIASSVANGAGAAAASAGACPASTTPTGSGIPGAPGVYANPYRGIQGLQPERVDQGVDYAGSGPLYPIGNAVILNTTSGGWPGGAFISYRLSDGPAAGLVVYMAENITPSVQVGQTVNVNTVIGQLHNASPNSETGWGDPTGVPQALGFSQWNQTNSTAYGANFNQLLIQLGCVSGIINGPVNGTLPPGWKG